MIILEWATCCYPVVHEKHIEQMFVKFNLANKSQTDKYCMLYQYKTKRVKPSYSIWEI